jgi:dTDP-4-dehydrorhamnose 3,5-epimerase
MKFTESNLKGSFIIDPELNKDERGWFARTYCKNEFQQIGHSKEWVQINHSFTAKKGTIRGMHFQFPPYSEIKMLRCISGVVFDVIVDIRKESPTFLNWVGLELSAENKKMLFIPEGFAHGFQTLTDNAELIYHHSSFYVPGHEGGLRFDDKRLNIKWPCPVTEISERDSHHPHLTEEFNGINI